MAITGARTKRGLGAVHGAAILSCVLLLAAGRAHAGSFFSGPLLRLNESDTGGRPVIVVPPKLGGTVVDKIWNGDPFGFVTTVKAPPKASPPSQAPERLDAAQLQGALSKLQVRHGDDRKPEPVFVGNELKTLTPQLGKALKVLQPGQDVVFAVTGRTHPNNAFEELRVVTGRMFFNNGDLNVIFGLMHGEFQGEFRATGMLKAFNPGYRDRRESSGWELVPQGNVKVASSQRSDWVVLSPAAWNIRQPATRLAMPGSVPAPSSSGQAAQNGSSAPRLAPQGENAAPMQPVPPAQAYYERFKRRLEALQKLRKAGVITEKEYQEKRKQILNQL